MHLEHSSSSTWAIMTNDNFRMVVERGPDTVFGMDVGFFSYSRLPKGKVPDGLIDAIPELVCEVRSPSDRWTKVVSKAMDYLAAGVTTVIALDPKTESATVFRSDDRQVVFETNDTLVVPDVLPDFSVPVRSLFD